MSALNLFSTSVANHTGALVAFNSKDKRVSFDPMSIIMMLSTILPPILEAFRNCKRKRQESVDPVSLRTHVSANMFKGITAERQEMALAREIEKEIGRQKKLAAKAEKEGGVAIEWTRFNIAPVGYHKLAHNIVGKFAACSDAEVIELCKDANGVYVAQSGK